MADVSLSHNALYPNYNRPGKRRKEKVWGVRRR
jgi:hypothetical protein